MIGDAGLTAGGADQEKSVKFYFDRLGEP